MTINQTTQLQQKAIEQAIAEPEKLPLLPSLALDVKAAIAATNTTNETLAEMIKGQASFEVLLQKAANSPAYATNGKPDTLASIIGLIGMTNTHNLIMVHCIKTLFHVEQPQLKKLFDISWQRQVGKASFSKFFAYKLAYDPVDDAAIASLLTEAGSIVILTILDKAGLPAPNLAEYVNLCRKYSKPLVHTMLHNWQVEPHISTAVDKVGEWNANLGAEMDLLDILNLALYHTIRQTKREPNLPDLTSLPAYQKLQPDFQALEPAKQQLVLVSECHHELKAIKQSFS